MFVSLLIQQSKVQRKTHTLRDKRKTLARKLMWLALQSLWLFLCHVAACCLAVSQCYCQPMMKMMKVTTWCKCGLKWYINRQGEPSWNQIRRRKRKMCSLISVWLTTHNMIEYYKRNSTAILINVIWVGNSIWNVKSWKKLFFRPIALTYSHSMSSNLQAIRVPITLINHWHFRHGQFKALMEILESLSNITLWNISYKNIKKF